MALLRILLAILLTASLGASTPWTLQDKALEGVFVAAATADWGQTLGVDRWAKGNDTRRETNGALGKHPSRGSVNVYFAAMLLSHALIADRLPGRWRPIFQALTIGIEANAAQHNYALGVRLEF